MFTGLVEDVGSVVAVRPSGRGRRVVIRTDLDLSQVRIGDSIAVNGACLTAEVVGADRFEAVAASETVAKTTLGRLRAGQRVHLEQALRVGARLGGHLVQGHVDGVGQLVRVEPGAESSALWVEAPKGLGRYIAAKGSICLDGVSLTVNELDGMKFRVNIVPHTRRITLIGELQVGDEINVEVDILSKYVERLMGQSGSDPSGLSLEMLARHGFTS